MISGNRAHPVPAHAHPAIHTLRAAREATGLSRQQWCAKAGVSVTTLRYWENGWSSPRLADLETALRAAGHRLVAVPIEEAP